MHTLSAKSFLIWCISMEIFLGWYADWIMENICRLIHNTIRFFWGSKKRQGFEKEQKLVGEYQKQAIASEMKTLETFSLFCFVLLCYFEKMKIGIFFGQCLNKYVTKFM